MISLETWKNMPMPALDKNWQDGETETTNFNGANWEYQKAFLDAYRYEYDTAVKEGTYLMNFQEWIALEEFLGQRIDYTTFRDLSCYFNENDVVNGDILELGGMNPMIDAFRKGDKALWTASDSDDNTADMECMILGLCSDCDLFDIGPMYNIRLADGREVQAFYNELKVA